MTYQSNYPRLIIITALLLFVVALLPRVVALGQFLTVDEQLWWGRSRDFWGGIIDPNFECPAVEENDATVTLESGRGLACTLRAGHPGVITMWSGGLGIWLYYLNSNTDQTLIEFVKSLKVEPIDRDSIFWMRLPTAIISALFVGFVFLILVKILRDNSEGYWIALTAAIFMALSPFSIALSRVLHVDSLATVFISLALLTAFYYWIHHASRRWLLLSGVLAGASFVAKSPALFLMPYMALLGGWYLGWQWFKDNSGVKNILKYIPSVVLDGVIWLATALITAVMIWPALWIFPRTVVEFFLGVNFGYVSRGHEKGNFFLGAVSNDPGFLFYPVNWLLHVTPIVLIGVLLGLMFWLKRNPGDQASGHRRIRDFLYRLVGYSYSGDALRPLFLFSLVFAVFFTWFIIVSTKKQDRYLLPIYPFLYIVATVGWFWLGENLKWLIPKRITAGLKWRYFFPGLVILIIVFNGFALIRNFPYYFTYYNPLLGGLKVASRLTTVGWGEGLDLAAAYLNDKPEADSMKVASWYGPAFAPFFAGNSSNYFEQKGKILGSDYVVVYINQVQRQLPDNEFFEFLKAYAAPDIISLNNTPYVWIYPSLGLDHYVEYERLPDVAEFLGWQYTSPNVDPDYPVLQPGDSLEFELWWEYLGKQPDEELFLLLVGPDYRIWLATTTQPDFQADKPSPAWEIGEIISETGKLFIPPGTPPGNYTVHIGFYPDTSTNPENMYFFELGDNPRTVTIEKSIAKPMPLPPMELRAINIDSIKLLGQRIPAQTELKIDEPFELELYWQALDDVESDYKASLVLQDHASIERWAWEPMDLVSFYPTSNWEGGELVLSKLTARPTLRTPGGNFQLALNIYDHGELKGTIPLTSVTIQGRKRQFELTEEIEQISATFAKGITLAGFQISPQKIYQPGDDTVVHLFWRADKMITDDYTVFVQLLGSDGQIYGQMDSQPQNGGAPTSHWAPGEIIKDTYHFTISENALPGEYQLLTGMYQFETGERLVVESGNENFIRLTTIDVQ